MIEPKPQRKGRDFAIGFIAGLLPLVLSLWMINTTGNDIQTWGLILFLGGGLVLFSAMIVSFYASRTYIGLGILALMATAPFLIYGACS